MKTTTISIGSYFYLESKLSVTTVFSASLSQIDDYDDYDYGSIDDDDYSDIRWDFGSKLSSEIFAGFGINFVFSSSTELSDIDDEDYGSIYDDVDEDYDDINR